MSLVSAARSVILSRSVSSGKPALSSAARSRRRVRRCLKESSGGPLANSCSVSSVEPSSRRRMCHWRMTWSLRAKGPRCCHGQARCATADSRISPPPRPGPIQGASRNGSRLRSLTQGREGVATVTTRTRTGSCKRRRRCPRKMTAAVPTTRREPQAPVAPNRPGHSRSVR